MNMKKMIAVAAVAASAILPVQAENIVWEPAQNITGTGDVITDGTLLYAYAKSAATLNGVNFSAGFDLTGKTPATIPNNAATPDDIEFSPSSGTVENTTQSINAPSECDILKSFIYCKNNNVNATVTLRNLTPGKYYLVQFWVNDSRTSSNFKTRSALVDGGNQIKYCNGSYGQHITGLFIASADTQSFTLTPQKGSASSGNAMFNAIQVRDLGFGGITWKPAQNITGTGDVITVGTLLYAYAKSSATLNGVNFFAGFDLTGKTPATIPNNAATPDDIEFSPTFGTVENTTQSINAPSECDILKSFIYCANYNVNAIVTLKNLTPGKKYLVQFWVNDSRTSSNIKTRSALVDGGNQIKYCNGSYGQHIMGVFTAAADSAVFTLTPQKGSGSTGDAQINAIQVRDLGELAENTTQTWSGAAETSLSWNGQNWDGNANVWTVGNDAVFATDGAIADVDSDTMAASVTFDEDATVTGTGVLIVEEVNVAGGKTATIDARTSGVLAKTGAGTLVLGSSRSIVAATLSDGTLELSGSASLDMANFTLGTDAAKPVTLCFGPTATLANNSGVWNTGAGVTSTVVKAGGDWAPSTFHLGNDPDAVITFRHEGGTLSSGGWVTLGEIAGVGLSTMVISGGTVSSTWAGSDANDPYRTVIGARSDGTMIVTGGAEFNTGRGLCLGYSDGANGRLDISDGGVVTVNGDVIFGRNANAGSGTVNIGSGGTLIVDAIRTHEVNGIPAALNFDGGTLAANASNAAFIKGITNVVFGAGGVTLDTAGYNLGITNCVLKATPDARAITLTGDGTLDFADTVLDFNGPINRGFVLAKVAENDAATFTGVPSLASGVKGFKIKLSEDGKTIKVMSRGLIIIVK